MTSFLEDIEKDAEGFAQISLLQGESLFVQGDEGRHLYIVIEGRLQAHVTDEMGRRLFVGYIGAGDPVGEMQVFTGGKRTATVIADENTTLVELPAERIDSFKTEAPTFYARLEELVLRRLRRNHLLLLLPDLFGSMTEHALRVVEDALTWRLLKKGERLIQQGEQGDAMYIVLSGRLQVLVADKTGVESPVLEIGRGETVGEMALFTDDVRTASVDALRETMLVSISKSTFFSTMAQYPKLHEHITRVLMRRLQNVARPIRAEVQVENIVIIPLHATLNIASFAAQMSANLTPYGSTLHVSRERLSQLADFRPEAEWFEDTSDNLRLTVWLDKIERHHRFILFEADAAPTTWTRRLIQYADRVLLVADATQSPALTDVELKCLAETSPGQQFLVLQHPSDTALPTQTMRWLQPRKAARHFHVREGHKGDESRLARFMAGKSIGLVLGGGGARGFAHIGIIQAFREAGIPIDMVGGTSMGGVLAAHTAMELGVDEMIVRNRKAFFEERPFRKALFPVFSFYKSKKLDEVTHQVLYQDSCIEDFWLPCFMISCSLGTSEMIIHEHGKAWEAVRASTALPGVVAPVSDGRLLHVDGGLMNNLPVDVMRERCAGPIVAVEASDMTDLDAAGLEAPSLFNHFKNRWFGQKENRTFPSVLEILMRSLLLGSIQQVKKVKAGVDLMLSPPVDQFGLLEFEAIEELVEIGYQYARESVKPEYFNLPVVARDFEETLRVV